MRIHRPAAVVGLIHRVIPAERGFASRQQELGRRRFRLFDDVLDTTSLAIVATIFCVGMLALDAWILWPIVKGWMKQP
jgi:hypothetical protein